MDFIERLFHIAPDGGDGMTELAIVFVVLLVPAGIYWLRKRWWGKTEERSRRAA